MPHLKLQKLVYYSDAWHLAILNGELIVDDFQAWAHGPVSFRIWKQFKSIDNPMLGLIKLDPAIARHSLRAFPSVLTREQVELLEDVIKEYGNKSAYYLECLTHSEEPWINARKNLSPGEKSSAVIPKKAMAAFYRSRLKN